MVAARSLEDQCQPSSLCQALMLNWGRRMYLLLSPCLGVGLSRRHVAARLSRWLITPAFSQAPTGRCGNIVLVLACSDKDLVPVAHRVTPTSKPQQSVRWLVSWTLSFPTLAFGANPIPRAALVLPTLYPIVSTPACSLNQSMHPELGRSKTDIRLQAALSTIFWVQAGADG